MKEFMCRGYDYVNRQWQFGFVFAPDKNCVYIIDENLFLRKVESESVGRYVTEDFEGKAVYEGDKVRVYYGEDHMGMYEYVDEFVVSFADPNIITALHSAVKIILLENTYICSKATA